MYADVRFPTNCLGSGITTCPMQVLRSGRQVSGAAAIKWLAVKKTYQFEGPKGKVSLLDLFERRRQLNLYRAFFEPGVFGWPDHACRGCWMGGDQVAHLNARDTTLAYASREPRFELGSPD
jgi:predicted dithiol-disulfide oxidoreductase (DUF899 family)